MQVRVVNQPFVVGWLDGRLYLQPYDVLEDDTRDWNKVQHTLLGGAAATRLRQQLQAQHRQIDWSVVAALARNPRGVPVPVTTGGETVEQILAGAPRVQNVLPEGSTWDGRSDLPMDEATFRQIASEVEPETPAPAAPVR